MSNNTDTPHLSTPRTPLVFPPIPLASGDLHSDGVGGQCRVAAVTVLVSSEGLSEPLAMSLEYRFGGWWAPTEHTYEPGQINRQTAESGE